ncbi:MAG: hypothetical protein KIT84_36390 [Labilithrix sp.]|nr:hypothetical protein [Labilithrix sp.]MCW5816535.1 hypothetical protein [Labilithrix sp.]
MRRRLAGLLGLGALAVACGAPPTPKGAAREGGGEANPLGPSYVLIPLPTEDQTLLGRILPTMPAPGRSLEETSRANPCAAKLSEAQTTPLASSFEDAQEVSASASAKAMLGTFGFQGDVNRATHFVYKLETQKRVGMRDTTEYDQCCKAQSCGYGYVSALIYGEGEYATGEETTGSAGVSVAAVASASGSANVKILHKRKVKGWLAAVVTVTDDSKKAADPLGPLGIAQAAGITEATVPETVKNLYERDKIAVNGSGDTYTFRDGRGATISENEFARRYGEVTGNDELDPIHTRRNKGSFYASGSLLALSVGALAFGLLNLKRNCTADDISGTFPEDECKITSGSFSNEAIGYDPNKTLEHPPGIALATAGALGTVGFGIWFLVAALRYDGSDTDHYMNDRDAVLYSTKYNRALLRRTIKQVQKTQSTRPRLTLEPQIGLGSLGLSGTF